MSMYRTSRTLTITDRRLTSADVAALESAGAVARSTSPLTRRRITSGSSRVSMTIRSAMWDSHRLVACSNDQTRLTAIRGRPNGGEESPSRNQPAAEEPVVVRKKVVSES
jgi:hypothetical protein